VTQEVTEEDLLHDLDEIQRENSEDDMKVKTLQGEIIRVTLLSYAATYMVANPPHHLGDDGQLLAKNVVPQYFGQVKEDVMVQTHTLPIWANNAPCWYKDLRSMLIKGDTRRQQQGDEDSTDFGCRGLHIRCE
jgi:hypothetical protein